MRIPVPVQRVRCATAWLVALAAPPILAAAASAQAGAFDPRLGAPFAVRDRPSLGSNQAPIVVVEFGSYKCSHCAEFHERVFPSLDEQYIKTNKVQWFMVPASDDPSHESSRIFAIGRCLQRQGKFWGTLDFLMSISNKPPSFLDDLVDQNPLVDADAMGMCLQDRETRRVVSGDFDEYRLLKVQGTPTFLVRKLKADGTRAEAVVRGYQPVEYFQRLFDELAKVP